MQNNIRRGAIGRNREVNDPASGRIVIDLAVSRLVPQLQLEYNFSDFLLCPGKIIAIRCLDPLVTFTLLLLIRL